MSGQELVNKLAASGTGEGKIAWMQRLLDKNPQMSEKDIVQALDRQNSAELLPNVVVDGPWPGSLEVTIEKAKAMMKGTYVAPVPVPLREAAVSEQILATLEQVVRKMTAPKPAAAKA